MGSTFTSVAAWRRMLLVGITALVALLAVSFTAPQDAHAFMDPTTVTSSHVGWVYVRETPQYRCGVLLYYGNTRCGGSLGQTAWRWSGSSWSQTSIAGGTQVYAYPYSGAWHWIWTQRTGWLAIETSKLETGYRCSGYNCPLF
jgi:hypothetical protein